jgi:hypothetical protein
MWLMSAVPHDVPGAHPPKGSTYVASYSNVAAADAGNEATRAAAQMATARKTRLIENTSLLLS